jgi:hypothetical protein
MYLRASEKILSGRFVGRGIKKFKFLLSSTDISDSLDEASRMHAIIIDFSKAFDPEPHGRLLKIIAALGVDSKMVLWIREFLIHLSQRVRGGRHYLEEVE